MAMVFALRDGPHSWSVFLSEPEQTHFLTITLSLTEFFLQCEIKNLSFIRYWNQALWVLARLKSWLYMTEWLSTESLPRGFESQS